MTTTETTDTTTDLELRPPSLPTVADFDPAEVKALVETYSAFDPSLDIEQALEMTLGEGAEIKLGDLTRIKVPSAEITDLMVPDPDRPGKLKAVDKLIGIPVGQTSRRSYWISDQVTGAAPDCSSRDMKFGVGTYGPGSEANPTGECAKCPMNVPGSANKGTMAAACKEQKLVFLLSGEEILPYMLIVPPGSLQNHKGFGMTLFKSKVWGYARGGTDEKGKPIKGSAWQQVEVSIGLDQTSNKVGQAYNQLTFDIHRKLTPTEQAVVDTYSRFVEGLIEVQADQLDAVSAEAAAANGGATTPGLDDLDDEGLPEDDVPAPKAGTSRAPKGR